MLRYNAATKIQARVRGRLLSQQRRVNMMVASGLGKAELLQREADEFQSKAELLQREAAKFQKEAADRLRAMMKSHEEKRAERKRKAEQPALDPPPYESPNHGYFPRCRGFRNNPPTCFGYAYPFLEYCGRKCATRHANPKVGSLCVAGCGIVSWNGQENEHCSKWCRENNARSTGKSKTDQTNFELEDDDE